MKTDAINEHFNEELAKAVETVGCKHLISFDTLKPIDLKKKADAIKIKRKSVVENEAYNVPVKRLKTATDLENRSPF
uniref:Uncharacterized protein n=1 Tax=Panagrolaimus superbus TaxID=310955 RepID=A0A914YDL6_9BILA